MLKLKTLIMAVMGIAWMAISVTAPAAAETTMEKVLRTGEIIIAVQTQGPPVSFIDKNGKRTGLAIELSRLLAKDMGVKLVIKDYDWKGLIPALLSGKADFIAADMTPTVKRSMQIVFTQPIFYSEVIAFAPTSSPLKSWTELNSSKYTIAATQGTTYADAARKYLEKADLKVYSGGTAQSVQAVLAGRANAGISDRAGIAGFQKSLGGIKVLSGEMSKEPLSFAVRPDSMHLLQTLDNYVRLIQLDGRLKKELDYWWNSTDWQADHK